MWTLLKLLAIAGLCYLAVTAWVYFSQRRLLYYPTHSMEMSPSDVGLTHEDVRLINGFGTRLHGWWLPRKDARFVVLFSHGNGGNVSHRVETFRIFHRLGLATFIYDYSGYGQSGGQPSEEATRADARAAWDWLIKEQNIAPDRIILFGRSLGGAVTAQLAADLAAEGTAPAGIIMESTFTSVADMGEHLYPWLPVRQLVRYRYDSGHNLADIRLPALFAHAPEDEIIPFELGRRLYESYRGPKTFMPLRGDHNSGYLLMGSRYPEGLDRFLATVEQERAP